MQQFSYSRKAFSAALTAVILYVGLLFLAWSSDAAVAAENALMEKLQAIGLAIAWGLFLYPAIKPAAGLSRFACWSLSLCMLSMLLRELDVEHLGWPPLITSLGSGLGRDLLLGGAFIGTFIGFVRRWDDLGPELFRFTLSTTGLLLGAGCVLYAASLPLDKDMLGIEAGVSLFLEEAVECGATLMFLFAAVWNGGHYWLATRSVKSDPSRHPAGSWQANQA